jgi:hypothetical protein
MARLQDEALEALAAVIASRVKGASQKPILRVVPDPKPRIFDSITRAACLKRIRFLRSCYRLHWLVDQSTFGTPGLDSLADEELGALLTEMERARECISEGIPFEDADLLKNTADDLPDWR